MQKKIILILFSLLFNKLNAQDFEIIKTDNSEYPLIQIYIKTDSDTVNKEEFTLTENNTEINFKFKALPASSLSSSKAVFFMIDVCFDKTKTSNPVSIKTIFLELLSKLSNQDKINIGFFCSSAGSKFKTRILSAEFTTDFVFLKEAVRDFTVNNEKRTVTKYQICDNIISTLKFIKRKNNLPEKKILILITGAEKHSEKDFNAESCKLQKKDLKLPLYVINYGSVNPKLEQFLIDLTNKTEGIYTKTKLENIPEIIDKYLHDASLTLTSVNSKIYLISFKTKFITDNNYFEISYKGSKKKRYFSKKKKFFGLSIRELYLSGGVIIIILLFLILYMSSRKKRLDLQNKLTEYQNTRLTRDSTDSNLLISKKNNLVLKIKSSGAVRTFNLTKQIISIGRNNDNDIILTDNTVSGNHAEIYYDTGKFVIKDIGSTNGTYVNKKKIAETVLKNKDKIKIGKSALTIMF